MFECAYGTVASCARDRAIAPGADASRGCLADALHEGRTQEPERTSVCKVRRLGEVIEIPLIDDNPRRRRHADAAGIHFRNFERSSTDVWRLTGDGEERDDGCPNTIGDNDLNTGWSGFS